MKAMQQLGGIIRFIYGKVALFDALQGINTEQQTRKTQIFADKALGCDEEGHSK